jgi:transposase
LRGGIDKLLAQVVRGFALGAQAHSAYVFANRRADRLKVLVYEGLDTYCPWIPDPQEVL